MFEPSRYGYASALGWFRLRSNGFCAATTYQLHKIYRVVSNGTHRFAFWMSWSRPNCTPPNNSLGLLMTTKHRSKLIVSLAVLLAVGTTVPARASELDDLKAQIQSMQKNMEQM